MVAKGPFQATACEAAVVFHREDELRSVIDQIQRSGFDRSLLSVLSHMELVEILHDAQPLAATGP